MEPRPSRHRLSSISTLWSLVLQAKKGPAEAAPAAQQQLLERYGGAIRRYLVAAVGNEDTAEELFQEFALCLLQGNFSRADPAKGRFRDYVKGILCHLVAKYHKRNKRRPKSLTSPQLEPAVEAHTASELDHGFLEKWRDELLARSWAHLSRIEDQTGQPFYTILQFRAAHLELSSGQIAEQLSTQLGKPLNAAGIRQTLHRARERFADLLVEEVAQTLAEPTPDQIEQELLELGLLEYCRPALQRRS
jgi:DNA-directed RNA polymerase specialized sigma24 family protein